MKRLLDTNAYVALKKGDPRVEDLVRACEHLYFSIVVLGELYFGFHNGSRLRQNVAEVDEFLRHPFVSIALLSRITADRFGRIAAQAMEFGSELISFDEHFARVPGLLVVHPAK
jgi:tRNA(fMet)-specific endonuclease VapC